MSYLVTSEKRPGYLLIRCAGVTKNLDDMRALAQKVYEEFIKDRHAKVLLLNTEVAFPTSTIDYYELVNFYTEELPEEIRRLKLASIVRSEDIEMIKFWETVCVNRGFNYHGFTSEAEGTKWLMEE